MYKIPSFLLLIGCLFLPSLSYAQFYIYNDTLIEKKIDSIVSKMTPQEKLLMLGGYKNGKIRGIARFQLPDLQTNLLKNHSQATSFPSPLNLAASWDSVLVSKVGSLRAREMGNAGFQVICEPNGNLLRSSLDSDNGMFWGEDPWLAGKMGAAYIKGIQSQKVVAAITGLGTHYEAFAHQNIQIEERAFEERYMAPYRLMIQEGRALSVCIPYQKVNDSLAAQDERLLTDILKGECLFEGFTFSAPNAIENGVKAAKAGLDLELPSTQLLKSTTLSAAIASGQLSQGLIDDKIKRILRMYFYLKPTTYTDAPSYIESKNLANEAAKKSIVLLKNSKNVLPLDKTKVKTIGIVGPYATQPLVWQPKPADDNPLTLPPVSILEGMTVGLYSNNIKVEYAKGLDTWDKLLADNEVYTDSTFLQTGWIAEYFPNNELKGEPQLTRIDSMIDFADHPALGDNLSAAGTSVRWQGVIEAKYTGEYTFFLAGHDGFRVYVNDKLVWDEWKKGDKRLKTVKVPMTEKGIYAIRVEHFDTEGKANLRFGYLLPENILFSAAVTLAQKVDAVVVCVGYDKKTETHHRYWELPPGQSALIQALTKANKQVIVVLNGGGSMETATWIDSTAAVFHALYPGEAAGNAFKELLLGEAMPSAKLPFVFEKKMEDNPANLQRTAEGTPSKIAFKEGIFSGYRHYRREEGDILPLYPFGYGLSYTTFTYGGVSVSPNNYKGEGNIVVSFAVTNTGTREGSDIAQIYVRDVQSLLPRPPFELRTFKKVTLKPGETQTINVTLTPEALAFYSPDRKQWITENGVFEIAVGNHAQDLAAKAAFVYSGEKKWKKKKRR